MATARSTHTATQLPSGRVLVAGGFNNTIGSLASAELYDERMGTWTTTGSLFTARQAHAGTRLPSGGVLVVAGFNNQTREVLQTAEVYDEATATWTPTISLFIRRQGHTATLLPSGKVLVAAGEEGGHLCAGYRICGSAELWE
jgi:hypothetical protein